MLTWFERLVGFSEVSPHYVRENLVLDGEFLRSRINGRELRWGRFDMPSLAELRERVHRLSPAVEEVNSQKRLRLYQVVANVQDLHKDRANSGALFQVASQFNLLEMAAPNRIPEEGVGIYQDDPTQGPACAMAAGAGTIYRNYFVPIRKLHGLVIVEQAGQSAEHQVDTLADLGAALGNDSAHRLWRMRNGYVMASSKEALLEIQERLRLANEMERDALRQLLRVGLQLSTQVTLGENCTTHCVSQVYCSALPVGYSPYNKELWCEFAQLVLEATYEATICAAILNAAENVAAPSNRNVFLTLVGGGVFANEPAWILHALERALHLYKGYDLDVSIVSHRSSNAAIGALVDRWNGK
jgi:hypothetical protein